MTPPPLFSFANLQFSYPGPKHSRNGCTAIDFSSNEFHIRQGVKTVLLGPSGCGKTTLLQICGLLRQAPLQPGQVVFDSTCDYAVISPQAQLELRRNSFGFILQTFFLLPNFSMVENTAMPLIFQGMEKSRALKHAREFIQKSGLSGSGENDLEHNLDKTSDQLSQGQKQRVAILRALIHDPTVIFADEFTSNLDGNTIEKTFLLIDDWQKKGAQKGQLRSLVLVTHDQAVAARHGDHFVVINESHRLKKQFSRQEFSSREAVNQEIHAAFQTN